METRPFGPSGLELSLIGLGCNNFGSRIDYAASESVVRRALDLGINHFDTADVYGGGGASETFLGKALGTQRKEIVLVTKFGLPMNGGKTEDRGSRGYVLSAVEASLRRLGTDWIDLLFMHVPDPLTPIEETLRALDELRKSGKVRHIGASNFSAAELAKAAAASERLGVAGFAGCQDELNLLQRKIARRLQPQMQARGLGLIPFRPLAGGLLSGKYRRGAPLPMGARYAGNEAVAERLLNASWHRIEALRDFAEARGHTLLELAMSWLARQPRVVSILTGATKPEQLDANVKSVGWALSNAELRQVEKITATRWWEPLVRFRFAGPSTNR